MLPWLTGTIELWRERAADASTAGRGADTGNRSAKPESGTELMRGTVDLRGSFNAHSVVATPGQTEDCAGLTRDRARR